jgi:hypothetical protein
MHGTLINMTNLPNVVRAVAVTGFVTGVLLDVVGISTTLQDLIILPLLIPYFLIWSAI